MPIGDLLASITGEPSPTQANASRPLSQPTKRKPSDTETYTRPADKLQRTNSSNANPVSRPSIRSERDISRPRAVDTSMSRMKLDSDKRTPVSSISSPIASSAPRNGQPSTPSAPDPRRPPPKKGSYAEIMARGKMAQQTMGQVGAIKHKRIEKQPSRREREDMKTQKSANLSKNIGPNGKFRNTPGAAATNGKSQVSEGRGSKTAANVGKGKAAPPVPEKKIKKAALATTGYAGTARPKPGAKPGSKPTYGSSARERERDRYGRRPPALGSREDRYESYDEDDDMEEDDQPDYESDVSSDMEAAAFEVDEEEEMAAKIARKEDQLALEEENRLKREKLEKKKKLMAMAKKAEGKKRY
ncbi:hypothetical protein HYALB_00005858 [Hymenoscyphus albidus]|uniref:SPT2 chromatin protein n=1 Tax=Hymenoscyphus albidus TaxID=595503 RepID=A0A9N9LUQ3_9HELO|nr:hypothetical protein HYALB_00005858 [Hymenoscyphus albidus]